MDDIIAEQASALAGTFMTEQWGGAHVYKVGTRERFKMFAILRPGEGRLTVKAPSAETRTLLIEAGVAAAHSHLPRGDWVVLHLEKLESDDVCERIRASYDRVLLSLPKTIQASLSLPMTKA